MKIKDLANMSRVEENALIWRHTHKDSRGVIGGAKTVMVGRVNQGTCLVTLDDLTPEERAEKLRYAIHQEKKRRPCV